VNRIGIDDLRDAVLDPGSFVSWDTEPLAVAPTDSYAQELAAARSVDRHGDGTGLSRV